MWNNASLVLRGEHWNAMYIYMYVRVCIIIYVIIINHIDKDI